MSYSDRADGYKGVKYGAGAMGLLGVGFLLKMCSGALGGLPPSTPESVELQLLNKEDSGQLFATLKRTYPQEFAGLTKEIADRGAEFQSDEKIGTAARGFILSAMARHIGELAQAPHDALAAYRRSEIALLEAIKSADVGKCATYFKTGTIEFPVPPPTVRGAMIDFQIKSWEGFAAGRDARAHRVPVRPSKATSDTIAKTVIAGGVDTASYNATVSGAPIADSARCGIGIATLRAVDALPGYQADGFTAFVASAASGTAPKS